MTKNKIHYQDDLLFKSLLKDFEPEIPSAQFKKDTMAKILHQWSLQPEPPKTSQWFSVMVITGLSLSVVGIAFLLDYYSVWPNWKLESFKLDMSFARYIEASLQSAYHYMVNLPGIYFYTLISGSVLLTFDFLIKKKIKPGKNHLVLF